MVRRHVLGFTALALLGCTSYVAAGCGGNNGTNNSPQTGNSGGEEGGTSMTEAGASSGSSSGSGGANDSGTKGNGGEAGADGGHTPSSMYPAFPVDVVQLTSGGQLMSAPKVVTVTWSNDPNVATWQAFDDTIGASMYWHTINSEYGVGPASGGGHVNITTTPPTSISDADLDTLVSTNIANGTWPANTADTIYAVYLSPSTDLTLGGALDAGGQDVCTSGIGAYHTTSQTGNYVYAVMPQCPGTPTAETEISASHELNESATDPLGNGVIGVDQDHLAFLFFLPAQWEVGDACEAYYPWVYWTDTESSFPYSVQLQWSNASAKAAHNPCVPAPSGAFYNVTGFPSEETTINVDLSSLGMGFGPTTSKGYKGTLNQPITIHLGAFSDAPTSGPWNLAANVDTQLQFQDQNGNPINNGTATVTLDKTSVINGDMITVTITPTAWSSLGVVYVWFRNILGDPSSMNPPPHGDYPILISQN